MPLKAKSGSWFLCGQKFGLKPVKPFPRNQNKLFLSLWLSLQNEIVIEIVIKTLTALKLLTVRMFENQTKFLNFLSWWILQPTKIGKNKHDNYR